MTTREQTFDEAIAEYIVRCKEWLGKERPEGVPPGPGTPYPWTPYPYESPIRFDAQTIKQFAVSRGDTNPLYLDPEYAKTTRYGGLIAPAMALMQIRSPNGQGPNRPRGYPVGDFWSGVALEFFDVVRVGDARFTNTKINTEFIEKPGAGGQRRLFFLVVEIKYWDAHGDLRGRASGTLTMVPIEAMGSGRAMNVERLGEGLMYTRKASQYSPEEIQNIAASIDTEANQRRGANTLYWEDVEIGERLPAFTLPPFGLQDQVAGGSVRNAQGPRQYVEGEDLTWFETHFEGAYHENRRRPGNAGTHPVTRWPWGPRDEHGDALTAPYRGQPLPFDAGAHRACFPNRFVSDWMGDDGFIRRYQIALRRPVYYSDCTIYSGEVVKKFVEVQEGDNTKGGIPGKANYHAVGIKVEGTNQVGQTQLQGAVTVYLPSRKDGPVQLPIPHPANPAYVPYEKFYRDWYG